MDNWMAKLNPLLLWTNVILPGTHDSGAYDIDYGHPMPGNEKLRFGRLAKCYVDEWTITQVYTIRQQLSMGVRCFDLRIAYDGDELWVCHTFTCIPLQRVFDAVFAFAMFHQSELIVMRLREDYENRSTMTPAAIVRLLDMVNSIRSQLIKVEHEGFTIGELRNAYRNIACVWTGDASLGNTDLVLPSRFVAGHWANTDDIDTLSAQINWNLQNRERGTDAFYELSFTLTPDANAIKNAIAKQLTCRGTTNLETYADQCKDLLMHCEEKKLSKAASLISFDYADDEMVRLVANLNFLA